jgi:hypothetical protein
VEDPAQKYQLICVRQRPDLSAVRSRERGHARGEQTGQADAEQNHRQQSAGRGFRGRLAAAEKENTDVPERVALRRELGIDVSLGQVDRHRADQLANHDGSDDPADPLAVPGLEHEEKSFAPVPIPPGAKHPPGESLTGRPRSPGMAGISRLRCDSWSR